MPSQSWKPLYVYGLLLLILLALAALALNSGSVALRWGEAISGEIFWRLRWPRLLMAMLVGAMLGAAGLTYQAVLRNGMADPYILGVSSSAACFAVLGQWWFGTGYLATLLAAFCGGLAAIALLAALSHWQRRGGEITLLLSGVMLNFFMGGALMLAIFLSRKQSTPPEILYLAMGSFSGLWTWEPRALLVILLLGYGILFWQHRALDALQFGDNFADAVGVTPRRARLLNLSVASLLVAAAVACVGMIGFVGLLVPHLTRLLLPASARLQLPASLLGGAIFMVGADTLARRLTLLQLELPVGVVAALLGSPLFLYLLSRSLRQVR